MLYLAFSLGLMSSLHCVGMCGPIALALPVHQRSQGGKLAGIFLYNVGRAATYAFFGFLLGFVGNALNLAGLQRSLSIGTGVIMLGAVAILPNGSTIQCRSFLQKGVRRKKAGKFTRQLKLFGLILLECSMGFSPVAYRGIWRLSVPEVATGSPVNSRVYGFT